MNNTAEFIIDELKSIADAEDAVFLSRYFKTGKGQYGEGDIFLGIRVPQTRDVVKHAANMPFGEIQKLIDSEYHEARLAGFIITVNKFKKAKKDKDAQKQIFDFYIKNASKANNWDLVDISCRDVVGSYLLDKEDHSILFKLAKSQNLWEQRVSIVSTWMFIKHSQFDDTLKLAPMFFDHKHDLMHKATGWMLREVGKKNQAVLSDFIDEYRLQMPRTTLRYAIEHYTPEVRAQYMKKD